MKRIVYTIIVTLSILSLVGCGGGGSSSSGDNNNDKGQQGNGGDNAPQALTMKQNKAYEMQEGNTIIKKSDPTVIKVDIDMKTKKTTATLQSGSAVIE
jgi:hypothetical protein